MPPQRSARIRLVALHRNARQPVRELHQIITILGSGEGCDLILASDKVDAAHAAIVRLQGGAYLCDLGASGGTTLNGRRIRWARLADGDLPTIGPFSFRVELEEGTSVFDEPQPTFSLRNEPTVGVVRSTHPAMVIGSDPSCDVVLHDKSISRRHCLVAWTDAGPLARDLQRRRSVRLNGRRVNSERLASGDTIGLGRHELIFETDIAIPASRSSGVAAENQAGPIGAETCFLEEESAAGSEDPEATSRSAQDESMVSATGMKDPVEGGPVDGRGSARESTVADGVEPSDDEFLELVMQEVAQARTAGEAARTNDPSEPLSTRERELNRREQELKTRVIAAQEALDARARKLWAGLSEEREKLKTFQEELQIKARELLEAAHQKQRELASMGRQTAHRSATGAGEPEGLSPRSGRNQAVNPRHEEEGASAPRPAGEPVHDEANLERVFGGTFEPEAATLRNAEATARAVEDMLGAAGPKLTGDASLQEQAGELAELVRLEREEMEKAEARLEGLRFEISRLHSLVARSKERQQSQQAQLEARVRSLRANQAALRQERDEIAARMQLIESKEAALRARIEDSDRGRQDLERQAEELTRLEAEYEERRRELRASMESERHRLRLRQTELQRKAGELVRAARERRRRIETQVAAQRAQLEEQELEIKARRAALEDSSRAELQKTATELEQVLNVRLSDIETELSRRQTELDERMQELVTSMHGGLPGDQRDAGRGEGAEPLVETLSQLSSITAGDVAASSAPVLRTGPRIQEVDALREAVERIDGDERAAAADQPASKLSSLVQRVNGGSRWAGLLRARLNEKMASLRDGPEINDPSEETGPIPLKSEQEA